MNAITGLRPRCCHVLRLRLPPSQKLRLCQQQKAQPRPQIQQSTHVDAERHRTMSGALQTSVHLVTKPAEQSLLPLVQHFQELVVPSGQLVASTATPHSAPSALKRYGRGWGQTTWKEKEGIVFLEEREPGNNLLSRALSNVMLESWSSCGSVFLHPLTQRTACARRLSSMEPAGAW